MAATSLVVAVLVGVLSAGPATGQPDRTLRIFPTPPTLAPGESIELRAWFCRTPASGNVFGDDLEPGTGDDRCEVADDVRWSTEDPRIARVRPQRGKKTTLTGRKDGLTTLKAEYQATATAAFAHGVGVSVVEPLPGDPAEGGGAGPGEAQRPGPGVPFSLVVQPGFALLAPGDQQLFMAYRCPLLGVGDPRGADMSPGTADDFCRTAGDATWSLLGDQPVGQLDPTAGPFTVLTIEEDDEDTAFVAADVTVMAAARTAQTGTQGTQSGALFARDGDQEAGASYGVDETADPHEPRIPGDTDADGDVDRDDLERLLAAKGSTVGDARYDEAADFDGNGFVGTEDLLVLASNLSR